MKKMMKMLMWVLALLAVGTVVFIFGDKIPFLGPKLQAWKDKVNKTVTTIKKV